MQVVYNDVELTRYLKEAVSLSTEHPVLIDQYIQGKEIEVDAIADGEDILIPGIMEHVERAGVHSGDSISVYPIFPFRRGGKSFSTTRENRESFGGSRSCEHTVCL